MKRLSPLERAKLPLNDLGNARRVFEACRGSSAAADGALGGSGEARLLWLADHGGGKGAWIAFDGVRWSTDEGPARAMAFAHKAAMAIGDEVQALREAEPSELSAVFGAKFTSEMAAERCGQLYGHAVKAGNSAQTSAMLAQFKGLRDPETGEFVTQAWLRDFDAQSHAYHCANGTIRFVEQDGVWRCDFSPGHDPADRFMQVSRMAYDADATCPHWRERLEVLHHDPVTRTALQRIYGMGLTQLISDQAFYIFQGKGQDGKSMTNAVMGELHGSYSLTSDPQTFLQSPVQAGSAHKSDLVRLAGDLRLVVADEPPKNSTWDGQRIKQATGSKINARGAHATTETTFKPRWQLIVECNGLPKAPSDDRGFRRRFKLYPWVVQFGISVGPDGKVVPDEPFHVVEQRLLAEGSGILNWMIEGCLAWLTEGKVPEPAMSAMATASFWQTSSAMGEWLETCCALDDPDAREPATALYEHFHAFCEKRGDKPEFIMKQTKFGSDLNNLQIYGAPNHSTGKKDRVGIRLLSDTELAAKAAGLPAPAEDSWLGAADDLDGF